MLASLIAQRYAKALFEAASDAKDLDRVAAEAEGLAAALAPVVLASLARPTLAPAQKLALFEKAFEGGASPVLMAFIKAVLENKRERFLPQTLAQFKGLVMESQGRVSASLASAAPLSAKELASLSEALGKRFKKKIELTALTDARLLGGLKLKVGDTVYDGSLAARLDKLARLLSGAEAGPEPKKA